MKFVSNWHQLITLPVAADSVALSLPDGEYRLTLSDGIGVAATRWEVIGATVAGGLANLQRPMEGTARQEWPAGSYIYCSLSAGLLDSLFIRLASLEQRVAALEQVGLPANTVRVTLNTADLGSDEYRAGWESFVLGESDGEVGDIGAVVPGSVDIPGFGTTQLLMALAFWTTGSAEFNIVFAGNIPLTTVVQSVDVQGIGVLAAADASYSYNATADASALTWTIGGHDWATSGERLITFAFAA